MWSSRLRAHLEDLNEIFANQPGSETVAEMTPSLSVRASISLGLAYLVVLGGRGEGGGKRVRP